MRDADAQTLRAPKRVVGTPVFNGFARHDAVAAVEARRRPVKAGPMQSIRGPVRQVVLDAFVLELNGNPTQHCNRDETQSQKEGLQRMRRDSETDIMRSHSGTTNAQRQRERCATARTPRG